jgi:hypothetical protein
VVALGDEDGFGFICMCLYITLPSPPSACRIVLDEKPPKEKGCAMDTVGAAAEVHVVVKVRCTTGVTSQEWARPICFGGVYLREGGVANLIAHGCCRASWTRAKKLRRPPSS